jgi:hypothetical protein
VAGENGVNVGGGDGRKARGRHCGSSVVKGSRTGADPRRGRLLMSSLGRIPIRALFSTG